MKKIRDVLIRTVIDEAFARPGGRTHPYEHPVGLVHATFRLDGMTYEKYWKRRNAHLKGKHTFNGSLFEGTGGQWSGKQFEYKRPSIDLYCKCGEEIHALLVPLTTPYGWKDLTLKIAHSDLNIKYLKEYFEELLAPYPFFKPKEPLQSDRPL